MIIYITIILFFLGLYFILNYSSKELREGFKDKQISERCPNMLIQNGSTYFLYNSKLAKIPGVNPIQFSNLEDYTEFLEWQRSQGIKCPILYLQHSYNANGESDYKLRPNVFEPQGGLMPSYAGWNNSLNDFKKITKLNDSNRTNNSFYNTNSYPGFDKHNQNIGEHTPLDVLEDLEEKTQKYSSMATDTNWGGKVYTQSLVDRGDFDDNKVYKQQLTS